MKRLSHILKVLGCCISLGGLLPLALVHLASFVTGQNGSIRVFRG